MGFKCGIIGLPNVGKSTLFNALTETQKAEAANYPFATIDPNIGRVAVPDERLSKLSNIAKSEKIIPTFIDFVDIAGLVKGASKGEGLGNKFLSHIREVDAIAHVIRCFEDENITHIYPTINPLNDIDIIETELKLADLEMLQNKLISLEKKNKSGDKITKFQIEVIKKIQKQIDNNKPSKDIELSKEEKEYCHSLNLMIFKPMLYICNVDEKSISKGNNFSKIVEKKANSNFCKMVIVSAMIESQIAEFNNEDEKKAILQEIGLRETTLKKVINVGYDMLDLNTFFTCGPKETRAWTIIKNSSAYDAAGKIHTDFQKGFIRAETIFYQDFIDLGGEVNCRDAGKLRQEGKDYIVKDGDIFHFLFNV
tara:strand:+ start:635 stop:1735 length:1101 start_codon:yes stop_codon:yes gene_type:complete